MRSTALTATTKAVVLFFSSLNPLKKPKYRSLKEALAKNCWSSGWDLR